jgi:hypothetical protein
MLNYAAWILSLKFSSTILIGETERIQKSDLSLWVKVKNSAILAVTLSSITECLVPFSTLHIIGCNVIALHPITCNGEKETL